MLRAAMLGILYVGGAIVAAPLVLTGVSLGMHYLDRFRGVRKPAVQRH